MSIKNKIKARIRVLKEAKASYRVIEPLDLTGNDDEEEEDDEKEKEGEKKDSEEKPKKKPKQSGFCKYNPEINAYAAESAENLAELFVFIVASQLVRWPDLIAKYPNLIAYLMFNGGLFRQGEKRSEEKFPSSFSSIIVGKANAIDYYWKNRKYLYSIIYPLIDEFNSSDGEQKEAAALKMYKTLLSNNFPRLGLPKAGFATQLIIGRYGCIDSINSNILELPADIITLDKDGNMRFKTPGTTSYGDLTAGGEKMAEKYTDYLKMLQDKIQEDIGKKLWDNWCDIVAYKIKNPQTGFDVLMKGMKGGRVQSDYPRKYSKDNPAQAYMDRFASTITGLEVSKQHNPAYAKIALKEIKMERLKQIIKEEILKVLREEKELTPSQKKLAAKYPPPDKITRGDIIAAAKEKKGDKKTEEEADLEESSTVGNISGGMTKPPFGAATSKMKEEPKKLKGKSLAEMIKKKIAEKLKASDPKDVYAHTAGLGRAGTGATGLEEELDEGVEIEYLTEAEAKKKQPRLGKVTRNPSGSKKKFHVYVKCSGKVKKISFGDPGLSIKRDSAERRKSFRARHKCDKPEGKNRCTARYWSCYQWRAGKKVQGE